MKDFLQKVSLRLSMVLMAVLCSAALSYGQEDTTMKHKVYLYTYGDLTVDCPTEVESGNDLNFSVKKAAGVDYYVSVYRGAKVSSVSKVGDSSDDYVLETVETPVSVYVIAYDKITANGEV